MNQQSPLLDQRSMTRTIMMGFGVFLLFIVVGGVLWWIGSALGLGFAGAFLLAALVAPILVTGPILLWFYAQPTEKRMRVLGIYTEVDSMNAEGSED